MELFTTTFTGAALLLALLVALPVLVDNFKPFGDFRPRVVSFWDLVKSELGAVTVTYYARGGNVTINGSTTAPTTTQGSVLQKVAATIAFGATGDAQALFTHNMGLDASAPGYWEPEIFVESQSTNTYCPLITFDRTNTNVLKVNKPATDAPATVLVTLRRATGAWQ